MTYGFLHHKQWVPLFHIKYCARLFITYFDRSGRWNKPYRIENIISNSGSCLSQMIKMMTHVAVQRHWTKTFICCFLLDDYLVKDHLHVFVECLRFTMSLAACLRAERVIICDKHLWTRTRIGYNIFNVIGHVSTPTSIEICYKKFLHSILYESVQPIVFDVRNYFSISLL